MCLYVDKEKTKAAKERKKPITIYKQVLCTVELLSTGRIERCVVAPIMMTPYNIKDGFLRAKGKVTKPDLSDFTHQILYGDHEVIVAGAIHCYVKEPLKHQSRITIKCIGLPEDLVAVGRYRDIAFTKVQICKKDHQMLMDFLAGKGEDD